MKCHESGFTGEEILKYIKGVIKGAIGRNLKKIQKAKSKS